MTLFNLCTVCCQIGHTASSCQTREKLMKLGLGQAELTESLKELAKTPGSKPSKSDIDEYYSDEDRYR